MAIVWVEGAVIDRETERRHELDAALLGIEASAHGLRDAWSALNTAQVNQLAQAMVHEVRRVRSLLDDRIIELSDFDLAAAVSTAVTTARACGQQIDCALPAGLVVHGCSESATQVVVGLLDNARLHAAGSRVQLHAAINGDAVTLLVQDRGPGIPRRLRAGVFDRGVRGARSTGSGLGLSIARRLMADQGGLITARRRLGGGTTFVLTFRRAGAG